MSQLSRNQEIKYKGRMVKLFENERGHSLIELVIVIILLGLALPALFMVHKTSSSSSLRNEIVTQCMQLTQSALEEIIAYKRTDPFWYKTISRFSGVRHTTGKYTIKTQIYSLKKWGKYKIPAIEVQVTAFHPVYPEGYTSRIRFTIYDQPD